MEHEKFKDWLYLSVYGELGSDERARLDEHLQSCDECRLEHERLLQMLEVISESDAGDLSEEAVAEARRGLSAALAKERPVSPTSHITGRKESILDGWFGAGRRAGGSAGWGGWLRGYRIGLAGAATLALGFLVGYLTFGRMEPVSPVRQLMPAPNEAYTSVSNVHVLDGDAADGEVELLYDLVRPVRLKAGMDDQRVRKILAHAILNGGNPGVRLNAINVLHTGGNAAPQGDVKQALLGALISDPNAGVRRRALEVLQRLPFDEDIKSALIFVLAHDENPGLRVAAMNYLTAFAVDGDIPEQEYRDILDAGRQTGRDERFRNRPQTY